MQKDGWPANLLEGVDMLLIFRSTGSRSLVLFAMLLAGICSVGINRLHAQGATATILGTVTDASGAAVPDAMVEVRNTATGVSQNTTSDAQGRFRVPDLGVGDYEVQASKMGFQTVVHRGLTLAVGSQTVVDFSLTVGQQQQTVTVEGQVAEVETTNAAIGVYTSEQQMSQLPLNGRNFEQLILLAPGVATVTWSLNPLQGRGEQYSGRRRPARRTGHSARRMKICKATSTMA